MKQHLPSHDPSNVQGFKFLCEFCQEGFYSEKDMVAHRQKMHATSFFECSNCFVVYYGKKNEKHFKKHKCPMQNLCVQCGQNFPHKADIFNHLYVISNYYNLVNSL